MARPALARVDLDALRHNYRLAKRLAPGARAVAVVKANAYGHGAVAVARALAAEADAFGVACIEEALELRAAGVANPVLLLEGVFEASELALAAEQRLWVVVHCAEQLQWITQARLAAPLQVWLKMDSGMHRVGFAPTDYRAAHAALAASPNVESLVLMTHYARADETACAATARQREVFEAATAGLAGARCANNSAGIMAWPAADAWIRPGMMLYGASPLDVEDGRDLQPVMTLSSALISVRDLAAGEPVGYGGGFVTPQAMRIGVVAMGYGDGYPRNAPAGTPVMVGGRRTRLVGRVSMDMLTLDLGGLDSPRVGDPVELWGRHVRLAEVAAACATIPYELVTRMPARVPRRYEGSTGP
ncbi:MAG: alanine racemase [Burkholderiales bacterium]|nr:alanine racemase [Burkholderiales bacterium]